MLVQHEFLENPRLCVTSWCAAQCWEYFHLPHEKGKMKEEFYHEGVYHGYVDNALNWGMPYPGDDKGIQMNSDKVDVLICWKRNIWEKALCILSSSNLMLRGDDATWQLLENGLNIPLQIMWYKHDNHIEEQWKLIWWWQLMRQTPFSLSQISMTPIFLLPQSNCFLDGIIPFGDGKLSKHCNSVADWSGHGLRVGSSLNGVFSWLAHTGSGNIFNAEPRSFTSNIVLLPSPSSPPENAWLTVLPTLIFPKTLMNWDLLCEILGVAGFLADDIDCICVLMGVLHALTGDIVLFYWE